MFTALFLKPGAVFWRTHKYYFASMLFLLVFGALVFSNIVYAQSESPGEANYSKQSTPSSDDTAKQGSDGTETGSTKCTADEIDAARKSKDQKTLDACEAREPTAKTKWQGEDGKWNECSKNLSPSEGGCSLLELEDAYKAWADGKLVECRSEQCFVLSKDSLPKFTSNTTLDEYKNSLDGAFDDNLINPSERLIPEAQISSEDQLNAIVNNDPIAGSRLFDSNNGGISPVDDGGDTGFIPKDELERQAAEGYLSRQEYYESLKSRGLYESKYGSLSPNPFLNPTLDYPAIFQGTRLAPAVTQTFSPFNPNSYSPSSFGDVAAGNVSPLPISASSPALRTSGQSFNTSGLRSFTSPSVPYTDSLTREFFGGGVVPPVGAEPGLTIGPSGELLTINSDGTVARAGNLSNIGLSPTSIFQPVGTQNFSNIDSAQLGLEDIVGGTIGRTVSGAGQDLSDFAPPRVATNEAQLQEIASDYRLQPYVISRAQEALLSGDVERANQIIGEGIQAGEEEGFLSGFANTFRNGIEQIGDVARGALESGVAGARSLGEALGLLEPDPTEGNITPDDVGLGDSGIVEATKEEKEAYESAKRAAGEAGEAVANGIREAAARFVAPFEDAFKNIEDERAARDLSNDPPEAGAGAGVDFGSSVAREQVSIGSEGAVRFSGSLVAGGDLPRDGVFPFTENRSGFVDDFVDTAFSPGPVLGPSTDIGAAVEIDRDGVPQGLSSTEYSQYLDDLRTAYRGDIPLRIENEIRLAQSDAIAREARKLSELQRSISVDVTGEGGVGAGSAADPVQADVSERLAEIQAQEERELQEALRGFEPPKGFLDSVKDRITRNVEAAAERLAGMIGIERGLQEALAQQERERTITAFNPDANNTRNTVREVQEAINEERIARGENPIKVDGIVGPETRRAQEEAVRGFALQRLVANESGALGALKSVFGDNPVALAGAVTFNPDNRTDEDKVKALQRILGVEPDGVYGPQTAAAHRRAIADAQEKLGVRADGVAGLETLKAYDRAISQNLNTDADGDVAGLGDPRFRNLFAEIGSFGVVTEQDPTIQDTVDKAPLDRSGLGVGLEDPKRVGLKIPDRVVREQEDADARQPDDPPLPERKPTDPNAGFNPEINPELGGSDTRREAVAEINDPAYFPVTREGELAPTYERFKKLHGYLDQYEKVLNEAFDTVYLDDPEGGFPIQDSIAQQRELLERSERGLRAIQSRVAEIDRQLAQVSPLSGLDDPTPGLQREREVLQGFLNRQVVATNELDTLETSDDINAVPRSFEEIYKDFNSQLRLTSVAEAVRLNAAAAGVQREELQEQLAAEKGRRGLLSRIWNGASTRQTQIEKEINELDVQTSLNRGLREHLLASPHAEQTLNLLTKSDPTPREQALRELINGTLITRGVLQERFANDRPIADLLTSAGVTSGRTESRGVYEARLVYYQEGMAEADARIAQWSGAAPLSEALAQDVQRIVDGKNFYDVWISEPLNAYAGTLFSRESLKNPIRIPTSIVAGVAVNVTDLVAESFGYIPYRTALEDLTMRVGPGDVPVDRVVKGSLALADFVVFGGVTAATKGLGAALKQAVAVSTFPFSAPKGVLEEALRGGAGVGARAVPLVTPEYAENLSVPARRAFDQYVRVAEETARRAGPLERQAVFEAEIDKNVRAGGFGLSIDDQIRNAAGVVRPSTVGAGTVGGISPLPRSRSLVVTGDTPPVSPAAATPRPSAGAAAPSPSPAAPAAPSFSRLSPNPTSPSAPAAPSFSSLSTNPTSPSSPTSVRFVPDSPVIPGVSGRTSIPLAPFDEIGGAGRGGSLTGRLSALPDQTSGAFAPDTVTTRLGQSPSLTDRLSALTSDVTGGRLGFGQPPDALNSLFRSGAPTAPVSTQQLTRVADDILDLSEDSIVRAGGDVPASSVGDEIEAAITRAQNSIARFEDEIANVRAAGDPTVPIGESANPQSPSRLSLAESVADEPTPLPAGEPGFVGRVWNNITGNTPEARAARSELDGLVEPPAPVQAPVGILPDVQEESLRNTIARIPNVTPAEIGQAARNAVNDALDRIGIRPFDDITAAGRAREDALRGIRVDSPPVVSLDDAPRAAQVVDTPGTPPAAAAPAQPSGFLGRLTQGTIGNTVRTVVIAGQLLQNPVMTLVSPLISKGGIVDVVGSGLRGSLSTPASRSIVADPRLRGVLPVEPVKTGLPSIARTVEELAGSPRGTLTVTTPDALAPARTADTPPVVSPAVETVRTAPPTRVADGTLIPGAKTRFDAAKAADRAPKTALPVESKINVATILDSHGEGFAPHLPENNKNITHFTRGSSPILFLNGVARLNAIQQIPNNGLPNAQNRSMNPYQAKPVIDAILGPSTEPVAVTFTYRNPSGQIVTGGTRTIQVNPADMLVYGLGSNASPFTNLPAAATAGVDNITRAAELAAANKKVAIFLKFDNTQTRGDINDAIEAAAAKYPNNVIVVDATRVPTSSDGVHYGGNYKQIAEATNAAILEAQKRVIALRETTSAGLAEAVTSTEGGNLLLHMPKGFDPNKKFAILALYHGQKATLERDVIGRQKILEQVEYHNVALVAPKLANVDSRIFGKTFFDAAAKRFAELYGNPALESAFTEAPIVAIGYSGGYLPLKNMIADSSIRDRVIGAVLFDGSYSSAVEPLAGLAQRGFVVNVRNPATDGGRVEAGNRSLTSKVQENGITPTSVLPPEFSGKSLISVVDSTRHADYITSGTGALGGNPITEILKRIPDSTVARIAGDTTVAAAPATPPAAAQNKLVSDIKELVNGYRRVTGELFPQIDKILNTAQGTSLFGVREVLEQIVNTNAIQDMRAQSQTLGTQVREQYDTFKNSDGYRNLPEAARAALDRVAADFDSAAQNLTAKETNLRNSGMFTVKGNIDELRAAIRNVDAAGERFEDAFTKAVSADPEKVSSLATQPAPTSHVLVSNTKPPGPGSILRGAFGFPSAEVPVPPELVRLAEQKFPNLTARDSDSFLLGINNVYGLIQKLFDARFVERSLAAQGEPVDLEVLADAKARFHEKGFLAPDYARFRNNPRALNAMLDSLYESLQTNGRLHSVLQDPIRFKAYAFSIVAKEVTVPSGARKNDFGSGAQGFGQLTKPAIVDTIGWYNRAAKKLDGLNLSVTMVYYNKLLHQYRGDVNRAIRHYGAGGYNIGETVTMFEQAIRSAVNENDYSIVVPRRVSANSAAAQEWKQYVQLAAQSAKPPAPPTPLPSSASTPTPTPTPPASPTPTAPPATPTPTPDISGIRPYNIVDASLYTPESKPVADALRTAVDGGVANPAFVMTKDGAIVSGEEAVNASNLKDYNVRVVKVEVVGDKFRLTMEEREIPAEVFFSPRGKLSSAAKEVERLKILRMSDDGTTVVAAGKFGEVRYVLGDHARIEGTGANRALAIYEDPDTFKGITHSNWRVYNDNLGAALSAQQSVPGVSRGATAVKLPEVSEFDKNLFSRPSEWYRFTNPDGTVVDVKFDFYKSGDIARANRFRLAGIKDGTFPIGTQLRYGEHTITTDGKAETATGPYFETPDGRTISFVTADGGDVGGATVAQSVITLEAGKTYTLGQLRALHAGGVDGLGDLMSAIPENVLPSVDGNGVRFIEGKTAAILDHVIKKFNSLHGGDLVGDLTVTSIGRKHIPTGGSRNSPHLTGEAVDFRTRDLSATQKAALVKILREAGFTNIITERHGTGPHIHAEFKGRPLPAGVELVRLSDPVYDVGTNAFFDRALRKMFTTDAEYEQARKIFFERFEGMPERFKQPLVTMLRKMKEAGHLLPGDNQPIMLVDASESNKGTSILSLRSGEGLASPDGRNIEMSVGLAAKGPINWERDLVGSNRQPTGEPLILTGAESRGDKPEYWAPGAIYTKKLGDDLLHPRSTWIHGGDNSTIGCVAISSVCSVVHQHLMDQVNRTPAPGQPGVEFHTRNLGKVEGKIVNGGFTYSFARGRGFESTVGTNENKNIAGPPETIKLVDAATGKEIKVSKSLSDFSDRSDSPFFTAYRTTATVVPGASAPPSSVSPPNVGTIFGLNYPIRAPGEPIPFDTTIGLSLRPRRTGEPGPFNDFLSDPPEGLRVDTDETANGTRYFVSSEDGTLIPLEALPGEPRGYRWANRVEEDVLNAPQGQPSNTGWVAVPEAEPSLGARILGTVFGNRYVVGGTILGGLGVAFLGGDENEAQKERDSVIYKRDGTAIAEGETKPPKAEETPGVPEIVPTKEDPTIFETKVPADTPKPPDIVQPPPGVVQPPPGRTGGQRTVPSPSDPLKDLANKLLEGLGGGGSGGGSGGGAGSGSQKQSPQETQIPQAPAALDAMPRLACQEESAIINGHATTTVRWACETGATSRGIGFETDGLASGQVTFSFAENATTTNTFESGIECIRNGEVEVRTCDITLVRPAVNVIGNQSRVDSGDTAQVIWASVGTQRTNDACLVYDATGALTSGGPTGSITTLPLTQSTEFAVACQTSSGVPVVATLVIEVNGYIGEPVRAVLPSGKTLQGELPKIEPLDLRFDDVEIVATSAARIQENPSETFVGTDADGNPVQLCNPEIGITRFTWCLLNNR